MSIELASMADRNISGFITNNHTGSRELQQSVRAKRWGSSSSKGVVCGCLRSTRGRKTDGVQWPRGITPGGHVLGSKILHR
jgi:hypothetical protein